MTENISKIILNIFKKKFKNKKIYLHEPDIKKSDHIYLKKCISENNISSTGKFIQKFEKKISNFTGSKYVVLTNSGTSALHISCLLSNIKKEEEVLVPSFTFVATVNVIKYCNATPHFVEVEHKNLNIDFIKLRKYLKKISRIQGNKCINKKTGKRIRAIIAVHVFGHPVNIKSLLEISKEFKLEVIEDAAEALGSFFKKKHVGTFGKFGTLSFNGNKIITCGSGGAILTNSKILDAKARHLVATAKINHPFKFIHSETGYNYRLSNINAAIGLSQLNRIEKMIKQKRSLYKFYQEIFLNIKYFSLIKEPKDSKSNYWLQSIIIKKTFSHLTEQIIKNLISKKIFVRSGWDLMTSLKPYKNCPKMNISVAKSVQKRIVCLPSSSFLINNLKKK